jgi:hypothetical protein
MAETVRSGNEYLDDAKRSMRIKDPKSKDAKNGAKKVKK